MVESKQEELNSNKWILKLTGVCIITLILRSSLADSTPFHFAASLGENIVYAVVLWFIFKKNMLHANDLKSSQISFIFILIAFMLSSLIIGEKYKYDMEVRSKSLDKNITKIVDSSVEGTSISTQNMENQFFNRPNTRAKKLLNLTNGYLITVAETRNRYLEQLGNSGLNEILNPVRLKTDNSLLESRNILKTVGMHLNDYEKNMLESRIKFKGEVEKLSLSQSDLKLMEESFRRGDKFGNTIIEIEKKVLLEFHHLIDILAIKPKVFVFESDQLLFSSDEYVEKYNKHIMNIQTLAKKQEQILKDNAKKYQESKKQDS